MRIEYICLKLQVGNLFSIKIIIPRAIFLRQEHFNGKWASVLILKCHDWIFMSGSSSSLLTPISQMLILCTWPIVATQKKSWTDFFLIIQAIEVQFWEQVLVKMHFSSNDHRDLCWQILGLQSRIRKKKQKWRDQRWISQFSCLSLSILCHKSPIRSCAHYGVWFDRVNTKTRINEQLFSEVSGKGIKLVKKKKNMENWIVISAII